MEIKRSFHFHSSRQMLQFSVRAQVQGLHQLALQCAIPLRIELAQVRQEFIHTHPSRHFLVFRHVPDPLKCPPRNAPRIYAQHFGAPARRLKYIHQNLDRRRLPCAVWTHQRVDCSLWHREIQAFHRLQSAEFLVQVLGSNRTVHRFRPPPSASRLPARPLNSSQCRVTAVITSLSSIPSLFASTANS